MNCLSCSELTPYSSSSSSLLPVFPENHIPQAKWFWLTLENAYSSGITLTFLFNTRQARGSVELQITGGQPLFTFHNTHFDFWNCLDSLFFSPKQSAAHAGTLTLYCFFKAWSGCCSLVPLPRAAGSPQSQGHQAAVVRLRPFQPGTEAFISIELKDT